jgi:hypothetical protein
MEDRNSGTLPMIVWWETLNMVMAVHATLIVWFHAQRGGNGHHLVIDRNEERPCDRTSHGLSVYRSDRC